MFSNFFRLRFQTNLREKNEKVYASNYFDACTVMSEK